MIFHHVYFGESPSRRPLKVGILMVLRFEQVEFHHGVCRVGGFMDFEYGFMVFFLQPCKSCFVWLRGGPLTHKATCKTFEVGEAPFYYC